MTVVAVAGALASKPGNGGEAWVRLSYALGFRRLGCDVRLVEEASGASPEAVVYARTVAERFGLDYGPADGAEGGDLLVNVSGNVRSEEVRARFRRTAFFDIDPGFTQFWHERGIEEITVQTSTSPSERTSAPMDAASRRAGWSGGRPAPGCARRVAARRRRLLPFHHRLDLALVRRADRAVRAEAPPVARIPGLAGADRGSRSRPHSRSTRRTPPTGRRSSPTAGTWSIRAMSPPIQGSTCGSSRARWPSSRSRRGSTFS